MAYIKYSIDGNQVCAVTSRFKNLQESPVGFGNSLEEAFLELMLALENRRELPDVSSVEDWEQDWLMGYKGLLD